MAEVGVSEGPEAIDAAWMEAALAVRHPGLRIGDVLLLERREATNLHARSG